MMQLNETEIDAPPELIWEVPTDLSTNREWNSHITAASDDPHEGSDVVLAIEQIHC